MDPESLPTEQSIMEKHEEIISELFKRTTRPKENAAIVHGLLTVPERAPEPQSQHAAS